MTGTLQLDAQGNNNAYWVFQIGSTLTTASSSVVQVINPGSNNGADDGVFWQVGSSATLGTTTAFEGNILALASITMNTAAQIINGRALAQTAAVTMDTNTITNVCPPPNGGPGFSGGLEFDEGGNVVPIFAGAGIISGMKFNDLNGNGVKDPGDPGLSGWTIYVDYNNDGVFQSATEPSAVSGIGGTYSILGVTQGVWNVREVGQNGWTNTFPASSDSHGRFQSVVVPASGTVAGVDFGNHLTSLIVIGPGKSPNTPESVSVIDEATGAVSAQFTPYGNTFRGGIRVATGDLTGDGVDEIVTAPGWSIVAEVRVYTQNGTLLTSFQPYGSGFDGGVQVAIADVDGDGLNDIVTVPSYGPAEVKVFRNVLVGGLPTFDAANPYRDFLAFPASFIGGAVVAAADMGSIPVPNGPFVNTLDNKAEIVVGSGAGMKTTVEVFDVSGTPTLATSFTPFSTATRTYQGGVSLSAARIDADLVPDIVVGAGVNGGSLVDVWAWNNGSPATLSSLSANGSGFAAFTDASRTAPVQVATLDTNGDGIAEQILAAQGPGGTTGQIRAFTITNVSPLQVSPPTAVPGSFPGPYFIATINNQSLQSLALSPVNGAIAQTISANQAPVLAAIPDQTISYRQNTLDISLSVTDPDGDALSYNVNAVSLTANQAYDLRQKFGLWAEPTRVANNYYCGYLGGQTKWLRGNAGSNDYYGIKPNGELIHLIDFNPAISPVVATLDASYWADPTKLTNAQLTETPVTATVDAAGKITVDPPTGFVGDIRVMATVSDGIAPVGTSFAVHVVNQAPTLAPVVDQTMLHRQDTLGVPLSVTDLDGDALSYNVNAVSLATNHAYDLRQQFGLWAEPTRVANNYYCGYLGGQIKWLRGNAGSNDYYGIKPNGELIHLVNFNPAISPVVATLDASYWTDPTKLTNAQLTETPVTATIDAAGKITVDPTTGFVGDIRVTATVSDGIAPVGTSFTVHVVNQAPTLVPVVDQTVAAPSGSVDIQLSATDADGDSLSYNVNAVSLTTNQAYDLRQQFGLWAEPTRVANNYYCGYLGGQIKWLRGNAGSNDYYGIKPNGELIHLIDFNPAISPVVATLDASYWADPTKLTNAQLTETPVTATVDAAGNVTIDPPTGFVGDIRVTATASDGPSVVTQAFLVYVVNQPPMLAAIPNQMAILAINNAVAEAQSVVVTPQATKPSASLASQIPAALAHASVPAEFAAFQASRQADAAFATTASFSDRHAAAAALLYEEPLAPKSVKTLARTRTEAQQDYHDLVGMALTDYDAIGTSLQWGGDLELLPILI